MNFSCSGYRVILAVVQGLFLSSTLAHATATATAADDGKPDAIIRNAKVITVDRDNRIAEAVALKGNRIVAVGTNTEVDALAGPMTKKIDAAGKALLPGLYDSHVHPLGAASSEKDHPIPSFASLDDIKTYISERVKTQKKGTWIVVRYAFPTRLRESRFRPGPSSTRSLPTIRYSTKRGLRES